MKRKCTAVFVVLFICLLSGLAVTTEAAIYRNYTTTPASAQEQQDFLKKINFRTLEAEPAKHTFNYFAVSERGQIALGFNSSSDAQIAVYNSDGAYLYGFQFRNNSSAYVLFFEGEQLSIFWSKSQYIGSFDTNGACIRLHRNINSPENADAYHRDRYRPSSGKMGELTYYADSIGLSNRYVRFTVVDREGNQAVIYDVMKEARVRGLVNAAIIVVVAVIGICIVNKTRGPVKREDT